ncbi:MAG: LytTR family DNA-binding domain-containing protein [Gemella sp.]|nr:LytTR family DNA-binding domain-containing protein [Gemella sp.]
MKLEIIKDFNFKESLIKIFTKEIDSKIQKIIDIVEENETTISAYLESEIEFLKQENIMRIFIENRKIYITTTNNKTYSSKQRLYEFENILSSDFIKISQSEIVNINFIKKLDFSFSGNIKLIFKNGDTTFVSRRAIKNFKEKLNI